MDMHRFGQACRSQTPFLKAPPLQGECSRPRVGQFRGAQCVKAKVLQMGGSQHAVITIFQLNKAAACFAGG